MDLNPGRVKDLVERSIKNQSCIPCHSTIEPDFAREEDVKPAICRGFWDSYRDQVQALEIGERLGVIEYDPVPTPREEQP